MTPYLLDFNILECVYSRSRGHNGNSVSKIGFSAALLIDPLNGPGITFQAERSLQKSKLLEWLWTRISRYKYT